jgi:hypothetical protein
MSSPTTGSAQSQPTATPAPSSTASEVRPSVRAYSPSAISAAEPIFRPGADPVPAATSFPANPASAAAATAITSDTCRGYVSRVTAA